MSVELEIWGGCAKTNIIPNSASKNCGFGCDGDLIDLNKGRFPANVITDGSEEVSKNMPYTKGDSRESKSTYHSGYWGNAKSVDSDSLYSDDGSACRYFYTAKASEKDRDEGLEEFELTNNMCDRDPNLQSANNPYNRSGNLRHNFHPTVKSTDLMQYLIRLVSPKGATILDCFMGSGSTGKAVMFENRERQADYKFIGIELTDEYLPICEARIDYALHKYEYDEKKEKQEIEKTGQMSLF